MTIAESVLPGLAAKLILNGNKLAVFCAHELFQTVDVRAPERVMANITILKLHMLEAKLKTLTLCCSSMS